MALKVPTSHAEISQSPFELSLNVKISHELALFTYRAM